MAFNGLMLTNDGRTLNAKVQQGKKLHITRVALGDGIIGNGSLVNRTALISQKISLLIDAISVINQTDAAIVVTLSNENLSAGFYFREIGVFAQDPDTLQEVCYLYDAAGPDGEYIPDKNASTRVLERLKLIVTWESATNVTFAPSGNPLYLTFEDIKDSVIMKAQKGAAGGVAELGIDGKVPMAQLPEMNYIPNTQKGAAGGVAELDGSGKVPAAQLPAYVDDVVEYATLSAFPAVGESGKIYTALDSNKTYRWGGSAYTEISASIALGETSSTAYPGDKGKVAYTHSQTAGNPHGTTAAQVGANTKEEVANFLAQKQDCLVVGMYTGNNVESRTINLGFAPKAVWICSDSGNDKGQYQIQGGMAMPGFFLHGIYGSGRNYGIRTTTDGFTVNNSPTNMVYCNQENMTYMYVALK